MSLTLFRFALLLCASLACAGKACATHTAGLHLATAHFSDHPTTQLRAETPGLYLRLASGATVGAFRNSYGHGSVYAGYTWETADRRFALLAGAVTGYSAARVMPLLAPSVRLPITSSAALRIALLPKPVRGGHSAALHLATEIDF